MQRGEATDKYRLDPTSTAHILTRLINMAPIAIHDVNEPQVFHQSVSDLSKNPLERTWRGNKANTLRINGYPDFKDATDEESLLKKRRWVQEHLAIAFRFWGKLGYGEGISGHITVRVSTAVVLLGL